MKGPVYGYTKARLNRTLHHPTTIQASDPFFPDRKEKQVIDLEAIELPGVIACCLRDSLE